MRLLYVDNCTRCVAYSVSTDRVPEANIKVFDITYVETKFRTRNRIIYISDKGTARYINIFLSGSNICTPIIFLSTVITLKRSKQFCKTKETDFIEFDKIDTIY